MPAGEIACVVSQVIADDRLGWAVSGRCPRCGDGSPEPADRQVSLRFMAVFRRDHATLAEVAASYAWLTGAGLIGTPAELTNSLRAADGSGRRSARENVGMRVVTITTDSIRLGQFLKLADVVDVGSDAKVLLDDGVVYVNGVREARRGRHLVRGDVVTVDGVDLRIA